jgi:site-specific DNA-methyltransferase (adenine-specific)
MTWNIRNDDVSDILPTLKEASFDACLCDPPYGVDIFDNDWDRDVPGPKTWDAIREAVKPGGYLLSYGGTDTWHRLAVAIEDGGFEIVDTIIWVYGNGMSTAYKVNQSLDGDKSDRYAGFYTRLKSAWTPIILARRPKEGTFDENIDTYDVGGMDIDGSRISCEQNPTEQRKQYDISGGKEGKMKKRVSEETFAKMRDAEKEGRFPANVITSPEVRDDMYPEAHDQHDDHYFLCKKPDHEGRVGLDEGDKEHPTIKPVALNEWLSGLVLPPTRQDDDRVLLNPFSGSGSEIAGAIRAGWERVEGVEKSDTYIELAKKRIPALVNLDID